MKHNPIEAPKFKVAIKAINRPARIKLKDFKMDDIGAVELEGGGMRFAIRTGRKKSVERRIEGSDD